MEATNTDVLLEHLNTISNEINVKTVMHHEFVSTQMERLQRFSEMFWSGIGIPIGARLKVKQYSWDGEFKDVQVVKYSVASIPSGTWRNQRVFSLVVHVINRDGTLSKKEKPFSILHTQFLAQTKAIGEVK